MQKLRNIQQIVYSSQMNYTNRLVHQWRSEEAAILVGTNTALLDNPSLTNRLWTGKNPVSACT
jgi:riboflavin biosynthesis pyrimidine reductase